MRISEWSSDVCSSDLSRTPWRGPFHTRCRRFRVPAAADWTASNHLSRYICSLATFVAHPWQALYFPNTVRPLEARWAGSYHVTPDQVQSDEESKITDRKSTRPNSSH